MSLDIPSEYRSLFAGVKNEWFGNHEVELDRPLTDGRSGAHVFLIDVHPTSANPFGELGDGKYILKLDRRNYPGDATEDERHRSAARWCPAYYDNHIAHLRESKVVDDHVVLVYDRPVCNTPTFLAREPRLIASLRFFLQKLSADLLMEMNRQTTISVGALVSPSELLHRWLGYRLDPEHGRDLQTFVEGIVGKTGTWVVDGVALVDALWFCKSALAKRDLCIRPLAGLIHGDLHLGNLLVNPKKKDQYWLIDFALSSVAALGYDHAYLEVSVILLHLSKADPRSLVRILRAIDGDDSGGDLDPVQESCVECLRAIRKGIATWRRGPEHSREAEVEQQMRLARIAAGLNWTNKKMANEQRILGLIYASWAARTYLHDYLENDYQDVMTVIVPKDIAKSPSAPPDPAKTNPAPTAADDSDDRGAADKGKSLAAQSRSPDTRDSRVAAPNTRSVSSAGQHHRAAEGEDFFRWVDDRLSNVAYLRLRTPVAPNAIQTRVRLRRKMTGSTPKGDGGEPPQAAKMLLAQPDIAEIERLVDRIGLDRSECEAVLRHNHLWEPRADILPDTARDRLEVFRELQTRPALAVARLRAIEDLLLTQLVSPKAGRAFYFNGALLAVSALNLTRQSSGHGEVSIGLTLQLTDYYTYRTIAGCSTEILNQLRQRQILRIGPDLETYLPSFQEFVSLSISALIVVHSMRDNKLFIRRRSYQAADFEDGGKRFVSACEGVYEPDIRIRNGQLVVDFDQVVRRALRNELLGAPPEGSPIRDLMTAIHQCHLVGACLYTPNFSIPLCFLVSVDCTSDEVVAVTRFAAHGGLEFYENPADDPLPLPDFTYPGVEQYVRDTMVTAEKVNDVWADGALVAVMLSLSAPR